MIMSTIHTPRRVDPLYPDSDGKPMAENTLQFKWIVVIKEGLEALFRHEPNVFVAGDLLWYAVEGKPKIRTAPDALVVLGRPKGYRGSYKQWEEAGIAPQVVFEVLSPGNRRGEMTRKFKFYEKYGVEEYYTYNPQNGDLKGWRREGDRLVPIPDMNAYTSPRLAIRFEPGAGPDNLTIVGPDGQRFLTYSEVIELRESERQRAESERQRAESERQRADRLAAKLRELGVEPD
ncbi:MAG: Uma2 family endonuclease [Isosphaeraceae bacterium]